MFCTYMIINNKNGNLYIGYAKNFIKRRNQHFNIKYRNSYLKNFNSYLYNSMNLYGDENFTMMVIYLYDNKIDAKKGERHIIKSCKESKIKLYNMTSGGTGGGRVKQCNTGYEKQCCVCNNIKSIDSFSKSNTYDDHDYICKECVNKSRRIKNNGSDIYVLKGFEFNTETEKYCAKCEQIKPKNEEHFYKSKNKFNAYCKSCELAQRKIDYKLRPERTDYTNIGVKLNDEFNKYCPKCKM